MQRSFGYLVVVMALIGIGIALSFYGAQLSTQNLAIEEGNIVGGEILEVSTNLDPAVSETGVFVVQTFDYEGSGISAKVIGPAGFELFSDEINTDSLEERFQIDSKGSYRLLIENFRTEEIQVAGVIGHMPDDFTLSIGITGFYILIVGLIGTAGVGIYVIKNRKKKSN